MVLNSKTGILFNVIKIRLFCGKEDKMRKGISIWSFAEQNIEKVFMLAHDAGFEGVEPALSQKVRLI